MIHTILIHKWFTRVQKYKFFLYLCKIFRYRSIIFFLITFFSLYLYTNFSRLLTVEIQGLKLSQYFCLIGYFYTNICTFTCVQNVSTFVVYRVL